jgi:hypothetical protein
MLSARFVSEGISDFVEVEAAIDDWLDAGSIDASHKIRLMLSTADNQTVKSGLFGHQLSGRDFTGAAGEDADQGDVAADRYSGNGLAQRARPSHLNDMIHADTSGHFPGPRAPIRMATIIDGVIGAKAARSL